MQTRAYPWYAKALLELSGKDKEQVEKRVLEVMRLRPELRKAWDHLELTGARTTVLGDAYLH